MMLHEGLDEPAAVAAFFGFLAAVALTLERGLPFLLFEPTDFRGCPWDCCAAVGGPEDVAPPDAEDDVVVFALLS